jgi:hypothetical protein
VICDTDFHEKRSHFYVFFYQDLILIN